MEKIGYPPRTPLSRKPQIFWGDLVIRGRNRFWKKSVIPLGLPLPENLCFIFSYFIRLFKFILTIKLLIRINPYNLPYSKNTKNKADIKNKNNEVLGKGERERENRFYKIGFPLAKKKVTPKKSARGRTDFTKIGFPLASNISQKNFIFSKQCFR